MLTKNQAIQSILADFTSEEEPLIWDYLSALILKHLSKTSNLEDKKKLRELIEDEKETELDQFIEERLDSVLPQVQEEIQTFSKKLKDQLRKYD